MAGNDDWDDWDDLDGTMDAIRNAMENAKRLHMERGGYGKTPDELAQERMAEQGRAAAERINATVDKALELMRARDDEQAYGDAPVREGDQETATERAARLERELAEQLRELAPGVEVDLSPERLMQLSRGDDQVVSREGGRHRAEDRDRGQGHSQDRADDTARRAERGDGSFFYQPEPPSAAQEREFARERAAHAERLERAEADRARADARSPQEKIMDAKQQRLAQELTGGSVTMDMITSRKWKEARAAAAERERERERGEQGQEQGQALERGSIGDPNAVAKAREREAPSVPDERDAAGRVRGDGPGYDSPERRAAVQAHLERIGVSPELARVRELIELSHGHSVDEAARAGQEIADKLKEARERGIDPRELGVEPLHRGPDAGPDPGQSRGRGPDRGL